MRGLTENGEWHMMRRELAVGNNYYIECFFNHGLLI
jgi:hypothetical protein